MATAQACPVFGCGKSNPCPNHTRQRASRDQASAYVRGYGKPWQAASRRFLRRYRLCGDRPGGLPPVMSRCREEGRIVAAQQVDHVVPHKGDHKLFWDERGNWQALCASCGGRKSAAGL